MPVEKGIAELIALADGTLAEIRRALSPADPAAAAGFLMREIAARAALFEGPSRPVEAQFELHGFGAPFLFRLELGAGEPQARPGPASDPPVTVRQDLAELLRAVYGPPGPPHDATRTVRIMNEPGPDTDDPDDPWLGALRDATLAAGQAVSACSPFRPDLGALARRFGSDKWGDHFYTPLYERHFAGLRDQRVRLLEIGVGGFEAPDRGGESLRMWRHYFRRGLVFGLDLFDKSALDDLRIATITGDQSDAAGLRRIAEGIGPLDIVIDDGSHVSDHVLASFAALFPLLAPGGLYVIEDLQTSYWPGWNGGRAPADPATTIGFLKTLLDALHHQDRIEPAHDLPPCGPDIRALHVYRNIAFIEKGANAEGTAPSWVRRAENDMDLVPRGSMRRVEPGRGEPPP